MTAQYLVFLTVAGLVVLSPGPGVVMTLTNALRFGARAAFGGIFGIVLGAIIMAGVSATSLGLLLAASAEAFTVIRWLGAAYLLYLGLRMWRAPAFRLDTAVKPAVHTRFVEGLTVQLTNPQAMLFFLSIFPQFIDTHRPYVGQFILLVVTHCVLIVLIHGGYALLARQARRWLTSDHGALWVNRAGGTSFLLFGLALAVGRR
jgi:homoserine/homoserine lactone efflux protein